MTTIHFPEEKEFAFVESYIVIDKITCDRKPFGTLSAEDYFGYAKTAQARGDASSLVDAMGNAKRCLDYQVKRLLYRYGLLNVPSNHFPARAQLLADLNIIPNKLLETFINVRNTMEHEYTTPEKKDVDGSIDLCDLLFLATDRYLTATPARIRIKLKNDERDLMFLVEPGGRSIEFYQIFGSELVDSEHGKFFGTPLQIPKVENDGWINEELKYEKLKEEEIEINNDNKTKWFPYIRLICAQARDRREGIVRPVGTIVTISADMPWESVKDSFAKLWNRDSRK